MACNRSPAFGKGFAGSLSRRIRILRRSFLPTARVNPAFHAWALCLGVFFGGSVARPRLGIGSHMSVARREGTHAAVVSRIVIAGLPGQVYAGSRPADSFVLGPPAVAGLQGILPFFHHHREGERS